MEQGQVIGLHELNTQGDEEVFELHVGNIREDWDRVRPYIQSLLDDCPNLSFRAEDVYAEVVAEHAVYWKAAEGFVVSTTEVDRFTGRKTFLVWIACAYKKGDRNMLKYYPFFQSVAKQLGMEALEVRTPHEAIQPILLGAGWELDTVVYRLEV